MVERDRDLDRGFLVAGVLSTLVLGLEERARRQGGGWSSSVAGVVEGVEGAGRSEGSGARAGRTGPGIVVEGSSSVSSRRIPSSEVQCAR